MPKTWTAATPSPSAQMREMLTVFKRQGIGFDAAWKAARSRVVFEHDTPARHASYAALDWAEDKFRSAYLDQNVPGGQAALSMAQMIEGGLHHEAAAGPATPADLIARSNRRRGHAKGMATRQLKAS